MSICLFQYASHCTFYHYYSILFDFIFFSQMCVNEICGYVCCIIVCEYTIVYTYVHADTRGGHQVSYSIILHLILLRQDVSLSLELTIVCRDSLTKMLQ